MHTKHSHFFVFLQVGARERVVTGGSDLFRGGAFSPIVFYIKIVSLIPQTSKKQKASKHKKIPQLVDV
jgi:hypothetical protein